MPGPSVIRFGPFTADLDSGELRRESSKIRLQAQPFAILSLLLHRPGEVITRDEIRQKLWPADTFVDFDHSLGTAINKIRTALRDSAEEPQFIETFPKRGYRFIGEITPSEQPSIPVGPAIVDPIPQVGYRCSPEFLFPYSLPLPCHWRTVALRPARCCPFLMLARPFPLRFLPAMRSLQRSRPMARASPLVGMAVLHLEQRVLICMSKP